MLIMEWNGVECMALGLCSISSLSCAQYTSSNRVFSPLHAVVLDQAEDTAKHRTA